MTSSNMLAAPFHGLLAAILGYGREAPLRTLERRNFKQGKQDVEEAPGLINLKPVPQEA